MKKKSTVLGVALLVGIVLLGVGYAASSGPFKITGSANANASDKFNVAFNTDVTIPDTDTTKVTASVTGDTSATMSVTLKEKDEAASATFTVKNTSPAGLKAVLGDVKVYKKGTTEAYSSDYFTVTPTLSSTTLASEGGTATLEVKVSLKKVALAQTTEEFDISIDVTPAQE